MLIISNCPYFHNTYTINDITTAITATGTVKINKNPPRHPRDLLIGLVLKIVFL